MYQARNIRSLELAKKFQRYGSSDPVLGEVIGYSTSQINGERITYVLYLNRDGVRDLALTGNMIIEEKEEAS